MELRDLTRPTRLSDLINDERYGISMNTASYELPERKRRKPRRERRAK